MTRGLRIGGVAMLLAIIGAGGCTITADLLNPDFLTALGLDPETVLPSEGVLIVTCSNDSTATANFAVITFAEGYQNDATGSSQTDLVALGVAPGESRSLIVDCPVAAVQPVSIVFVNETGATQVDFAGALLENGADYNCGSVINFQAIELADGQFTTRVQLLAGR